MLRKSLLSTAGFLTLAVTLAGALRLLPEEPMSAQMIVPITPTVNQPVHPDEPVEVTLNQRFSLADSLTRMQQIRSALTSFRQLTAENPKLTAGIDNPDWETQNLGFFNWTNSVEGTLRRQDYQIKKLELDLAWKQFQDGEISKAMLDQKLTAYQKSERDFRLFWQSFKIAD